MKVPVWVKIALVFSILILAGSIITILMINRFADLHFSRHIRKEDLNRANRFAPYLAEYYLETGGWEGINLTLPQARNLSDHRGSRMMRSPMMGMMGSVFQVILTDPDGTILAGTDGPYPPGSRIAGTLNLGVPVQSAGITVGLLFIGSMINGGYGPEEVMFLRTLRMSVFGSTLVIFLCALLFGGIFVYKVTSPVRAITRGASSIAGGNLRTRVPLKGHDDFTDLSISFNTMAESLERNEEIRKRLIADSAHELRTPVSLLQANIELMLDGIYPINREQIELIKGEVDRLNSLVSEMNQLYRIDSGRLSLKRSPILAKDLLEGILGRFLPEAHKKGISLDTGYNLNDTYEFFIDSEKIDSVLSNLIANALRHTPEGGRVGINLSEAPPDQGGILLRIEDSGPGIPVEERQHVFERFYRSDVSRNRDTGGSGLGLAIVKEIIELHGGEIRIIDTPLGGACFEIFLPEGPVSKGNVLPSA